MPFSDVAQHLEQAKLTFAASSNLLAHIDTLHLTAQQQQLLASIAHPVLRESVRDYCENQQFRRDVFVKGPRQITQPRQLEIMQSMSFVLTVPENDVVLKLNGPAGEAHLQADVYRPLAAVLAERRHAPKSVKEIIAHPLLKAVAPAQITQALLVLSGLGHASPTHGAAETAEVQSRSDALNAHILERAVHSADMNFLASPVTGAGVPVGRIQQLFLRSIRRGRRSPQEWALDIWPTIEAQNQRLMRDGKPIADAAGNIAELSTMGQDFAQKRLPILEALGVVAVDAAVATGPRDFTIAAA
jgi:hypothetical protein